jgi:hypothetical protein
MNNPLQQKKRNKHKGREALTSTELRCSTASASPEENTRCQKFVLEQAGAKRTGFLLEQAPSPQRFPFNDDGLSSFAAPPKAA